MKYALIGCGAISKNHIQAALAADLEIVALCDVVVPNMETALQLIPEERNRNFTTGIVLFVLFLYWLYSLWGDGFQWIFSR